MLIIKENNQATFSITKEAKTLFSPEPTATPKPSVPFPASK